MRMQFGGMLKLCRSVAAWFAVLCVPVAILTVIVLVLLGQRLNERTLVVEARTTFLDIVFASDAHAWPIPGLITCTRLAVPDMMAATGAGPCDRRIYEQDQTERGLIDWSAEDRARITLRGDGWLEILRSEAGPAVESEADSTTESEAKPETAPVTHLTRYQDWSDAGYGLAFDGAVTIGRPVTSGDEGYLSAGAFEFREKVTFGLGTRSTDVIKRDDIIRGEVVRIIEPDPALSGTWQDMPVQGHLTPVIWDDRSSLYVVTISRPGNPSLEVIYPGAGAPGRIRADWIDSVIASPFLLAIIILISFLGNGIL